MKKKTINLITTILGVILILAILPACFIIETNLAVILPFMLISGVFLIYVKNPDAVALLQRYLDKFK